MLTPGLSSCGTPLIFRGRFHAENIQHSGVDIDDMVILAPDAAFIF
jgi:hypothetical protein